MYLNLKQIFKKWTREVFIRYSGQLRFTEKDTDAKLNSLPMASPVTEQGFEARQFGSVVCTKSHRKFVGFWLTNSRTLLAKFVYWLICVSFFFQMKTWLRHLCLCAVHSDEDYLAKKKPSGKVNRCTRCANIPVTGKRLSSWEPFQAGVALSFVIFMSLVLLLKLILKQ